MNMHKSIVMLGAASALAACGQSNEPTRNLAANSASAEKPRPSYCFFKDEETKDWAAKADKSGNVVVTGKAYRQDSRYKAQLGPATVSGTTAEMAPTITVNDTGFATPDNWWAMSETIPASSVVTSVVVKCGDKTVATLSVARKK